MHIKQSTLVSKRRMPGTDHLYKVDGEEVIEVGKQNTFLYFNYANKLF